MVGSRLFASFAGVVFAVSSGQAGDGRARVVVRPAGEALVGVWVQYAHAADGGVWDNGGMYRVAFREDKLEMKVESLLEKSPEMGESSGLSEVKFDGKTWSFHSAWPEGRTGVFTLHRVADDLFEGSAQDADGSNPPQREIWQRIAFVGDGRGDEYRATAYDDVVGETRKEFTTDGQPTMIWWIPTEFWELLFASAVPLPEKSRADYLRSMRPYSMVAVVDGRPVSMADSVGSSGLPRYRSAEEIRKGLKLVAPDGSEGRPLVDEKSILRVSPMIEPLARIFLHLPDATRAHVRFFYFRTSDASGAPTFTARSGGDLTLNYDDRSFRWHLPLSSYVPSRLCPSCNESVSGSSRFCPWDGTKLPPAGRH